MISQPGTTNNCNTYIAHISKSKDCQTVKFGQLIEYNVRKIFLETSYPKCGGETSPKPFSENQNWAYLLINSLKFYTVYLYCMSSGGLSKYIETKL